MIQKLFLFIGLLTLILSCSPTTEEPTTFQNPVIPGFHPDPSICRVGDDYYLATSSFEWYPGIPIYHSKDLVNWKQIGHALNRPSQLKMIGNKWSSGVWAPTIRYNNGKFYVTATCKRCGNNFYVTADKPEGPYSEPIYVKSPPGIDPSFLFDDDGRVWFSANRVPKKKLWDSHKIIYVQEIDIETGELLGDYYDLTTGYEDSAKATEAPHIYNVDGKYFLIVAEGMTWTNHAVSMFVSDSVTGPYESVKNNLVMTHKHLKNYPITTTGHADLIQTQNGEWWAVLLGVRPVNNSNTYFLGRETFLVPVQYTGETFIFAPDSGKVLPKDIRPDLPWTPVEIDYSDDFSDDKLDLAWNFLRTPLTNWYSLTNKEDWLEINLRPETAKEYTNPSLIARRFQHHTFSVLTKMEFVPQTNSEKAGIIAIQNSNYHCRLVLGKYDDQQFVYLYRTDNEARKVQKEVLLDSVPYKGNSVLLGMKVDKEIATFHFGETENALKQIGDKINTEVFSSHRAGGFIGAYVGMYASSNYIESDNKAYFDWFNYYPENINFENN